MNSRSSASLVELPAIRAAFNAFQCSDLGEAYVIRDRLAMAATRALDIDRSNEDLLLLRALLRATYGMAVTNDLPTADTIGHASMWRTKIATLADLSDQRPHADATTTGEDAPRAMSFALHRYSLDSLLDAVAAALALPSQANVDITDVHFPEHVQRTTVEDRCARYWKNPNWAARQGAAGRAFPVLDLARTSVPRTIGTNVHRVNPWGDQPPLRVDAAQTIPDALRSKFERSHEMSKWIVTLASDEAAVLRRDPLFARNPQLIQPKAREGEFKMDVDAFLIVVDLSPEPVKVGLAAEIHEVLTGKSK